MKIRLKYIWDNNPLLLIMLSAIVFRFIAVIFAKGFGMHDDHFLVIESSQSWVDSYDYNNWLPNSNGNTTPAGHSFFYVGIHYYIFSFFKYLGIFNPQLKMFFIRLLHALFSLITVYLGYKITEKLHTKKTASTVGLLLSLYFFMPWLSVRNLVEVVCIPFLMMGLWLIVKMEYSEQKEISFIKTILIYFFAGLISGLALSVRFQSFFFLFGLCLAVFARLKWKETLALAVGMVISFCLLQGIIDYYIWGYPFAEFKEYVRYNIANANTYFTGPWYNYILLLAGILIPPISIFLLIGFFMVWRKHLLIFLPAFVFLLFHSIFPNKQERFIMPIIPFIIMLGMIGWNELKDNNIFIQKRKKILHACWLFFWIINLLLLLPVSTMYSKRARVESMTYLSKYQNIQYLLAEDSNHNYPKMFPRFYLKQWVYIYEVSTNNPLDNQKAFFKTCDSTNYPRFILFYGDKNIKQRVDSLKTIFPEMNYEATISPGAIDKLMYWLNPVNTNEAIYIYNNTNFHKTTQKDV